MPALATSAGAFLLLLLFVNVVFFTFFSFATRSAAVQTATGGYLVNTEAKLIIHDLDTPSNITLQFGDTAGKTFSYVLSPGQFEISDDLAVSGNISATGTGTFSNVGIGATNLLGTLHTVGSSTAATWLGLFAQNGATPENSAVISTTQNKGISVQGDGAAYFMGRDVTNDIEVIMGTSTSGGAFLGSMTNHPLWLRTNNATRWTLGTDGSLKSGTDGTAAYAIATAGAITGTSFIIGANTLTTAEWAYLDGQDQAVNSTGTPSFNTLTLPITTSTVGQIKQAGTRILHTYVPSNQTPSWKNIFIGENSGNFTMNNTVQAYHGTGNVGLGNYTLYRLTTGFYNFAIGSGAGQYITSGAANVAIGHQALLSVATANNNIGIGRDAGVYTTGGNNTYIGTQSGWGNQTGTDNVIIGQLAGFGSYQVSHSKNVMIGGESGYSIQTGSSNIFLGYKSGYRQTTNSNILLIDNQQRANIATELTNSIIYGVMAATPASQSITFNVGTASFGAGNISTTGTMTSAQFKLSALNTAPANAGDTGTLGEIRIVNGYIYVCVATNTWQRAALTTW